MAVVGIDPGAVSWATPHVPAGDHEAAGNVPGHCAAGMHAAGMHAELHVR